LKQNKTLSRSRCFTLTAIQALSFLFSWMKDSRHSSGFYGGVQQNVTENILSSCHFQTFVAEKLQLLPILLHFQMAKIKVNHKLVAQTFVNSNYF